MIVRERQAAIVDHQWWAFVCPDQCRCRSKRALGAEHCGRNCQCEEAHKHRHSTWRSGRGRRSSSHGITPIGAIFAARSTSRSPSQDTPSYKAMEA